MSAKQSHSYQDKSRGIRLQKVMADAGIASRRDCERLIETGHVAVNGQRVKELPAWVDPLEDRVEVDGSPLRKPRPTDRNTYAILNKPKGVISSAEDELGRTTVVDMVQVPDTRLFPVGRLDADSTGLILLTDDGNLAQSLTHPSFQVTKTYEVSAKGRLEAKDIERLKKGMYLAPQEGETGPRTRGQRRASVEDVKILGHQKDRTRGDRTHLLITLTEGQNREIRRLLARLRIHVKRLKRVAIGPIRITALGPGEWRLLTKAEVDQLYKAAGVKPPKTSSKAKRKQAGGWSVEPEDTE